MKTTDTHPLPPAVKENAHVDYSEMYRKLEMVQLKKRLRRTRNTLWVCAIAVLCGGLIFWQIPENPFNYRDFIIYLFVAVILTGLGLLSYKKPYSVLLFALILCLGLWAVEIIWGKADEILIEGTVHKLFIVSLLISALHISREAELIKKELHFS